ncbi:diacylglycerol kinase family protein [Cellulomonas sp. KRMCY2]|uniref:diacylglycerol/lipid kinase family protein n=1 Tax=Cellulomonas sp. KRMCY2 TaxID=1304865 RepID=UPI00045E894A|nr:diacylglycerol kinase family protein [Cellulomonas sp. KRMCY2]
MTWEQWLSVLALATSMVAVLLALGARRAVGTRPGATRPTRPWGTFGPALDAPGRGTGADRDTSQLVAFVANPTKSGVPEFREAAFHACATRYLPEPLWLETTETDPGVGQAKEAIEKGAQIIVAVGGDGTVRAVAEGLVGTGIPMALIPMGTGNLLARNLDLPLSDQEDLLRIALTGHDETIDVGWLTVERPDGSTDDGEHLFLVIAGLGFDAQMVAGADEQLKKRLGWLAYFLASVKHLHDRRLRVRVTADGGPPESMRLRTVLIGNCGRLPGGITLLPDAVLDDGWLDLAAIDTRGGLVGWGQLLADVLLQGIGVRAKLPARIGRIDHSRVRAVEIQALQGEEFQIDGEGFGQATAVTARVDPGVLVVRVAPR